MAVRTIEWKHDRVIMLDQRMLPHKEIYRGCRNYQQVAQAIRDMVIRDAPAIGVAAAMGVALGASKAREKRFDREFERICLTLSKTRPTAGYGTALGVIRALKESGKSVEVWINETRPFLQGARLTAWELKKEKIAATLVTDNMVGYLMQKGRVDAVVVGCDHVAANGDVAN